jgi:hypothetical protein
VAKIGVTELYPELALHPYYIVAPPYSRFSAGIKVLHLLCHALNRRGQQAYLLILPDMPSGVDVMGPDLLTPRLTQGIIDAHKEQGRTPVVVYPETIRGNPMNAPLVVRYLLNEPGLLGGDRTFAPDEIMVPYSEVLAQTEEQKSSVLFIPVSDTRIFRPPPPGTLRQGSAYYAMKYKQRHVASFKLPEPDSIEITFAQSPEELAEIFRRVDKFYCYEATSTALDAGLCGCPVISMPNEHLAAPIGAAEMGTAGHAWGNTPENVARAKATVGLVFEHYQESLRRIDGQLGSLIAQTQDRATQTGYVTPLRSPLARRHGAILFVASILASFRSSVWRREVSGFLPNGWRLLRRRGVSGILRRIRRGTVG